MTYGINTVIGKAIGNGPVPCNITDSRVYCYPSLATGAGVTSAVGIENFGSWTQVVSTTATTKDFTLLGYALVSADAVYTTSNALGVKLQFGVGAVGSEVVFASSAIPRMIMAATDKQIHTVPISFSGRIPAGSRVSVRAADLSVTELTYYLNVAYTTNLRQGGIFLNSYSSPSSNCYSAAITTSSTAWTYGSYTQIVQTGEMARDFYIRGLHIQHDNSPEILQSQIAISNGSAGSESSSIVAELPFAYNSRYSDGSVVHYFPLPIALKVTANSRVSVAAAKSTTTASTVVVGLDIAGGTFYG